VAGTRIETISEAAEAFFGEPVRRISAPGGKNRASYRVYLGGRTVIATLRPNFRRTHLEAFVLGKLSERIDLQPACLGVVGEILFQSDVGGRRLNLEIARADEAGRADLAAEAVATIFRIHAAAREARLEARVPHLGQNRAWIENFVHAADALAQFSRGRARGLDKEALCEMIAWPGQQFLKWDCRSGNAAIGSDDRLRWFDFEYAGARHGAEDLAWLIGDEAWPLAPRTMYDLVSDAHDPACGHSREDYLAYLSLYLTFHSVQRLKLVVKEAGSRGWLSKARIRKYDDAGVHPEFAAHLCRVGRFFADENTVTAPIARDFEEAEQAFLALMLQGLAHAEA